MVSTATDLLVQHSRRQLWVALVLVVILGSGALALLAFPGGVFAKGWQNLMFVYPEIIAGALLSLRRSKRQLAGVSAAHLQAVVAGDELRRHSLSLAWRNGFFVMLLAQPVFGLAVTWSSTPYPVALLVGASALAGVATALASVLYYDR
jgi:hypothetical protein